MNKIILNDGKKNIKNISVLALFRDCSEYLTFFFKNLEEMEKIYDVNFQYFFCENNSKDDTRQKLKSFAKGKKCKLLLLNLEKDYVMNETSTNLSRINALLTLRNKLKSTFLPYESDWTWIIDSGIYFSVDVLKDMFSNNTEKENIGMMVPYTQQVYSKNIIVNRPEFNHLKSHIENSGNELISLNHAFDTYSIIDSNKIFWYPFCPFEKCLLCKEPRAHIKYDLVPADIPIVEVTSAFCGFALIDSNIFNNEQLYWDTICLNTVKNTSLCEHNIFCDRVRTLSGRKVVILQNIKNVYRTF